MKILLATVAVAAALASPASALTMQQAKHAASHYASGVGAASYVVGPCHRRSAKAVSCVITYSGVEAGGASDWGLTERVWIVQRHTGTVVDSSMFGPNQH